MKRHSSATKNAILVIWIPYWFQGFIGRPKADMSFKIWVVYSFKPICTNCARFWCVTFRIGVAIRYL